MDQKVLTTAEVQWWIWWVAHSVTIKT